MLIQQGKGEPRPLVVAYHVGLDLRPMFPDAAIWHEMRSAVPPKKFADYGNVLPLPDLALIVSQQLGGVNVGPWVVVAFSAGGKGARAQVPYANCIVVADGIYASDPPLPEQIDPWKAFLFESAGEETSTLAVSCCQIPSGNGNLYAKDTLEIITGLDMSTSECEPKLNVGKAFVWACPGTDAAAHQYQLTTVMPDLLEWAAPRAGVKFVKPPAPPKPQAAEQKPEQGPIVAAASSRANGKLVAAAAAIGLAGATYYAFKR